MKKLFMFLAVAGLATFGTACSSSDDNTPPPPPEGGQLTLSASKTTLEINEKVTFAVKLDGKAVSDAEIVIDGTKISGYETSFAAAKTYKVVARKAGSKDSSELTITVKEKAAAIKSITLTSNAGTAPVYGQVVAFTVKGDTGADVTGTSVIKVNGVAITGNTYTLKAGNTKVVATYVVDGVTLTSNALDFNGITEPTLANYIEFDGVKYETNEAVVVYVGSQAFGADTIDIWRIITVKMDASGQNIENRMDFSAAFVRPNPAVKTYPFDGQVSVAAWAVTGFILNGDVDAVESPVTNASKFVITNFAKKVDSEGNEYSDNKTKFEFEFTLQDGKKVTGVHTGETAIIPEALPAARSLNGSTKSFNKTALKFSKNK